MAEARLTQDLFDNLISDDPSMGGGLETVPSDEASAMATVVATLVAQVRSEAATGPAVRDAHPKAHGCVRASFRVHDDLPAPFRVGLFAAPRAYDAYIRFSNGSPKQQPDSVADVRGMAIKVMGVVGSPSTTQDLVMINGPAFFVNTAADYVAFTKAVPQWRFFLPGWNPFAIRWREFLNVRAMVGDKPANPLDIRYWSTVPYLFAEPGTPQTAFKYSANPIGAPSSFTDRTALDFLHRNLADHLATGSAEFEILAQLRTDPDAMPIEDSRIEWTESLSPFVPVARLSIPSQTFDSPEQRAFGENLSFTPWHGLPAHRPLGGINRVRRTAYATISKLRHELNGVVREEPKGF